MQAPELKCMEPENYRKYFRTLCWSGTRKNDKKGSKKIGKKEKLRRLKAASALTECYAPSLLSNPSQFAVYAAVRRSILSRWKYLQPSIIEISDDSDIDDDDLIPFTKLPKITGIGLRTVFALISQARHSDTDFCGNALNALLDVLQGHAPEELSQEPTEIITNLHSMLIDVSGGGVLSRPEPATSLTALSSSCLLALSIARGEAELILNAVSSLIMSSPTLSEQLIPIPANLITLQRSVQSVILGAPSRNQWLNFGVPHQSLVTSFPVDLPAQITSGTSDLVVRSLVSDGCFLYVFTSRGLLKIGSGYGSSIRQHVYTYKPDFFASDRHGWLGYCKNKLYVRIGRKKTEVFEVDKDSLEVKNVIRLDPGQPAPVEPKSAVFSDGNQLGLVLLTSYDSLTIRMFDVDSATERHDGTLSLSVRKELVVHLLRRKTLAFGRAPFEDVLARRSVELDAPVAMQLEDNDDDPLVGISAGQDFALLTTASGRVYYTGKTSSLGYKSLTTHTSRWILMKESVFTRNDLPNQKKCKVVQVAVGHEGLHAILVLDNGTALFTGAARRGEDGDANKHRRTPKPTRPKKIFKAEGHHIVYAACNYGSTALVTRQGLLLMFGKDTQHCDSTGLVLGLKHERVIQVALGKAHAVALTSFGQVYTFGINNKGQCGRDFGHTRDKSTASRRSSPSKDDPRVCPSSHTFSADDSRQCVLCSPSNGAADEDSEDREICELCCVCRRCAGGGARADRSDNDDDGDSSSKNERVGGSGEGGGGARGAGVGRVGVPGGARVAAVAAGMHHTALLTEHGEVLTFGSNQYGQLGTGDTAVHQRIVRVRVPRAAAVAAGSNHTAVLTKEGEVYTFGSYQKGALGRPPTEGGRDRAGVWHATPARVPRLGPRHASKAVWLAASGDQTFMQLSQALIKTDTLFSSTITANANSIVILPNRPEHTFKCITINKSDGSCFAWPGAEQVDFVNSLAALDPLHDVMWSYQPQTRVVKCYNILAYDAHGGNKCCGADSDSYSAEAEFEYPNHGIMKRLDEFKNLENFEVTSERDPRPLEGAALSSASMLGAELALPAAGAVTRLHAALHLLACLDSLTYAHDYKLNTCENKSESVSPAASPAKEDLLTVNRFESHGGGWGYSGHSVEAIRFMCDTDIMLGGYGLFGGRGDYTARIKLFDLGVDGGDQEGDGELLAESDEVVYECAPRDRFPMLFDASVPIVANRWYVAWACINGPSSDCGSSGQAMVINDEIGFHFKTSKKSNNGTDVNAGQIPCLLYNITTPDHLVPMRFSDPGEPVVALTKNLSRKVTVNCYKSLITLLDWAWRTFKETVLDTNGQIPINFQKLTTMKHQKRLVYVIRACLRLTKSYINEIYPQNNRKRNSQEYSSYTDAIAEVRVLIQTIMSEPTPSCSMLQKKPGKNKAHRVCYVQFALEMTNSILKEAHETLTACFHAFFPTPALKWNHLCSLLYNVKDGVVPASQVRELTATATAVSGAKSLRDVLQHAVPVTQAYLASHDARQGATPKVLKDVPSKSATVPRSSHAQKPPPVPPRANREQKPADPPGRAGYPDWHLLDVVPRLLDIVLEPMRQSLTRMRQCNAHDHGEARQGDSLTDACCKLCARIVHDLFNTSSNARDELDTNTLQQLVTPSRFMRVNQSRVWNSGNGSPDAVSFAVDRAGLLLAGAGVFGGPGAGEYSLELLQAIRVQQNEVCGEGESPPFWASMASVHGAFSNADCLRDVTHVTFDKPVPLKEETRYALRLCNRGGHTANGDCGLPSVKGPDGTTFRFASCSLSFNGTTLARGQIPCLIYYGSTKSASNSTESTDSLASSLRCVTLRVAAAIMEHCSELLCSVRSELSAEDMRRSVALLQASPAVNVLIPFTLASLEGLEDAKGVIQLLELIRKMLAPVAALNLACPGGEDAAPTHYYTWVESEHPYKQTTVSNMRVLFPSSVAWVVLEMDPRSITAQPEDSLTVFAAAGAPKHKPCQCYTDAKAADPPFRKRIVQLSSPCAGAESPPESAAEAPCAHYTCTYVSVTGKLANIASEWPQKALLVPGNEVIFSLETASDYLNEYNKPNMLEDNRFGFRCLCVGYEDSSFTSQRQGLIALEMELVHAGAACAAKLLAPDLDIPPLSLTTLVEVQASSEESQLEGPEAQLVARGLELSSPPDIHHVLDGHPLLRSVSTERQFLSDLVSGAEGTAGGRLARWLAPTPRVDPPRCELRPPPAPPRPAARASLQLLVRDQYGDQVVSPALKVEVVVQQQVPVSARALEARGSLPHARYHTTVRDTMCFHAITMMKAYQTYSFEELRYYSGVWGEATTAAVATSGRIPAERLTVQSQPDGTYAALWTPKAPGVYLFRYTLDDISAPQELSVEVGEAAAEGPLERGVQAGGSRQASPPARVRRFAGAHSAGLRVRASPSLQAEELGRVPPGGIVGFVEELTNKDGAWVRLSSDSVRAYTDACAGAAWCLQHHRQLERTLLQLSDDRPQDEDPSDWIAFGEAHSELQFLQEDEVEAASNDLSMDDRRFPFSSIQIDMPNESDSGSSSPYLFGAEPSKRSRFARSDSSANSTPRRMQRRNNGNTDEWWSPIRHRSTDSDRDSHVIQETDIEPEVEPQSVSRLAQTGTQTSPEHPEDAPPLFTIATCKEARWSRPRARALPAASPPPLPARPPPPRKHALSPAQAECLRAVFAALLWHEGIVHDAIACAAFLKFHPSLPKQGARVVTRPAPRDPAARSQRHSVEVATAGQYLRIQASTLEALTRSGNEASASRARKADLSAAIHEEHDAQAESPSVVNVLPPALRALVALWDTLYEANQLSVATERSIKFLESNENERAGPKKLDWRTAAGKTNYSVLCELCGNINVPPPVAAHMRNVHLGCRVMASQGYDRVGTYVNVPSPPRHCGQLAQAAYQLWYMFCEQCRDKCIKSAAAHPARRPVLDAPDQDEEVDHVVMKENAAFLLDLAPLTNSESPSSTPPWERARSSGGVSVGAWAPAPPLQVLAALGAAPKPAPAPPTYHSLRRPNDVNAQAQTSAPPEWAGRGGGRVPRSVSMGGAGAELAAAQLAAPAASARHEPLPGAGSSLLAQPSAALQKLVNCSTWGDGGVSALQPPRIDAHALMKTPVMAFVLARRDLLSCRQRMDAAVRINTVRQFAFEALNWLLRSATQPTCVHDVMWWFCTALDKYARIAPNVLAPDNKEGAESPRQPPPPSTSALCPGGRAARGARGALHALLGAVSSLAPSLPPASPANLQAVRCWALNYSHHDRAFLHRSQVFSVISKILSHSEDAAYEESMLGALNESFHSFLNKENYIWTCPDITSWCDVTVSSRQGMAGALTDNTTETFWESGDEDRNKAKWIQVTYPGGPPEDRPYILCIHIDNTRDTVNKTLLLTFLYSGGSSELYHMLDHEVDPKNASWICYTLPRSCGGAMRVRAELRGPEAAVRVRQLRVLSAPAPAPAARAAALHHTCEADTLRVFRLLTTQVFGKLLEWGDADVAPAPADDSDLREHVVGILFAGHKLTTLQRQVMCHIVCAIGSEAARVRDDWETALLCDDERPPRHQDNYCFEMLSLLLALSGSSAGRAHLAQQSELLPDLLSLLHTGSDRVQRQVISLLRRMITEIPPPKMLAAINYGQDSNNRTSLLEHLIVYLAKAITIQVKVKGAGGGGAGALCMGAAVTQAAGGAWYMRGETSKKHAHLVAKLLCDMAESKLSAAWAPETRSELAGFVSGVARVPDSMRLPDRCNAAPQIWMCLAALCVCDQEHIDLINSTWSSVRAASSRLCCNHEDGSTWARVVCLSCGALCADCDRVLHLPRATRSHIRQICKEEETAIRVDIHEGCGRAKLFWLLLLIDRRTLKGLAEYRGIEGVCETGAGSEGAAAAGAGAGLAGVCRFCGARGNSGLLAIGNVCADMQCQELGKESCSRVLACGHSCGGVRDEPACLPCLQGCGGGGGGGTEGAGALRQDGDDMCMICFTDPLQAAPAIQLRCGHVFHMNCCKNVLANKWNGPRITFSFSQCPICKDDMCHWTLEELLSPIRKLREEVKRKALMRLEYEGLAGAAAGEGAAAGGGTRALADPATYAMDRYAYYVCHKCEKAYFGGLARCEVESNSVWQPWELVCGACSDVTSAMTCPKHGGDFLEYKCRYCCSVAVFFCFGTSHFCNACHDDFQRVTNIAKHLLPQCPAGPKGTQLPGGPEQCPLHVPHPPTGEEFALGCGVCRHAHAF